MTNEYIQYVVEERVKIGEELIGLAINAKNGNTMWIADLGYVTGIQQDMTYLHKYTIDEYMRISPMKRSRLSVLTIKTYRSTCSI